MPNYNQTKISKIIYSVISALMLIAFLVFILPVALILVTAIIFFVIITSVIITTLGLGGAKKIPQPESQDGGFVKSEKEK